MSARNLHRRRRGDFLTAPDRAQVRGAVVIDHIVATYVRRKEAADRKWGVGRLPEIVSPAMARKFGRAVETFEIAMMREPPDPDEIQKRVENLIKGIGVLDEAAEAAGCEKAPDDCISITVCGEPAVIALDRAAVIAIRKQRPGVAIYTIEEVEAVMSTAGMELVNRAKEIFEGAEIASIQEADRKRWKQALDDEIPF